MVDNISAPPDEKCVIQGCGRTRSEAHFGHVFTSIPQLASSRPPRADPFRDIRPATTEKRETDSSPQLPIKRPNPAPATDGPRSRAVRAVRELFVSKPHTTASEIADAVLVAHGADVTRGAIAQIARTAFTVSAAAIDAGLRTLVRAGKAHKVGHGVWRAGADPNRLEDESENAHFSASNEVEEHEKSGFELAERKDVKSDFTSAPKQLKALTLGMIAAIVDDAIRGMNTPTVPMIDDIHIAPEFNIDRSAIIAAKVKVTFSVLGELEK